MCLGCKDAHHYNDRVTEQPMEVEQLVWSAGRVVGIKLNTMKHPNLFCNLLMTACQKPTILDIRQSEKLMLASSNQTVLERQRGSLKHILKKTQVCAGHKHTGTIWKQFIRKLTIVYVNLTWADVFFENSCWKCDCDGFYVGFGRQLLSPLPGMYWHWIL